jgi:hypothetical protein
MKLMLQCLLFGICSFSIGGMVLAGIHFDGTGSGLSVNAWGVIPLEGALSFYVQNSGIAIGSCLMLISLRFIRQKSLFLLAFISLALGSLVSITLVGVVGAVTCVLVYFYRPKQ